MKENTRRFALAVALALVLSSGALAFGGHPVLITKPDYDDGHTALDPSETGTYFLTADGYPVVRDSKGDWLYVVNGTSMVLMPFGSGYVWTPAAGPAVMVGQVVVAPSTVQGEVRVDPSWYSYTLPSKP